MTITIRRATPKDAAAYARMTSTAPYSPDAASAGKRALRNVALDLLAATGETEALQRAVNDATTESYARMQAAASALSFARGQLNTLLDASEPDLLALVEITESLPHLYREKYATKRAHADDLAAARARLTAEAAAS